MKIARLRSFTLAEVLITLTVIGVLSAMTIPVLVSIINDKIYSTQLKEAYSVMSQATNLIKNDNGGELVGLFPGAGAIYWINEDSYLMPTYAKYVKTAKLCNTTNNGSDGCWHNRLDWFDDNDVPVESCNGCATLQSASGFWLTNTQANAINYDCTGTIVDEPSDICFSFYLDINGAKKPNKIGKDIHRFYLTKNGFFPTRLGKTAEMLK